MRFSAMTAPASRKSNEAQSGKPELTAALDRLADRRLGCGAFAARPGLEAAVEATAWAVVALAAAGEPAAAIEPSLTWLGARQLEDGRVPPAPELAEVIWPTPLAMLAWSIAGGFERRLARAADFLLAHTGRHWRRKPDDPVGHDTLIPGWPWVLGAHSWVVPTALAVLALRRAGRGDHPRVAQGAALLLDRQIETGGWNYGNTTVFGQRLRAMPDTTGAALAALAGLVRRAAVVRSFGYLEETVSRIRAPLSLGWGLLGLAAWDACPVAANGWIAEALAAGRQGSDYDTASLAVLIVAAHAPRGLLALGTG